MNRKFVEIAGNVINVDRISYINKNYGTTRMMIYFDYYCIELAKSKENIEFVNSLLEEMENIDRNTNEQRSFN